MTDEARTNTVPLKKVVLYKHGMGYFERRGLVEGKASIEILCGAAEIDDMLKSLMVLTADGARVQAITYDSAKTLEDRMAEFGFDVRDAKGLIGIISQMKGLPVTILSSSTSVKGRVVGLDYSDQIAASGSHVIREPFLILLSDATFRRLPLASITTITVDDPSFSVELNQQLELLFQNAKKKDKKALTVTLPETKGEVVVAYSIPSPIWKTSYRLVLANERLLMQGMAIVDNVQDEDWQNVEMVLISAAPISFIQPLYEPVQPVRKRVAAQGYQSAGPVVAERAQRMEPMAAASGSVGGWTGSAGQPPQEQGWGGGPPAPGQAASLRRRFSEESDIDARLDAVFREDAAAPSVEAGSSGELFEYRITEPVTVPRNTSALIPIVQEAVEGERLSLFNSVKNRQHPYCTVRLKNTSGLTLESGPVTIVEDGAYAGEALLDVLKPGDTRFLPYALDQDCHVIVRNEYEDQPIWRVRLFGQTVYRDYRSRSSTIYRIENLADKDKVVFVEHPVNPQAKVIGEAQPSETTESYHRFVVNLAPRQLQELSVIQEQELSTAIWIAEPENLDTHSLNWLIEQNMLDKEMLGFVKEILKKQSEIHKMVEMGQSIRARIQQATTDQQRARENLKSLGASNERYRLAIDDAEDKIIEANSELVKVSEQYAALRREFMEFTQQKLEAEVFS